MAQKDSDYNRCSNCKEVISKKARMCQKCTGKSGPTAAKKLPSDQEVLKEVDKTSANKAAKKYNVSYTTIQKIVLKYKK